MRPAGTTTVSTTPLAPTTPPGGLSESPIVVATPAIQEAPITPVHLPINIQDEILIPGWVVDLESFRRWARSEDFPRQGRFAFYNGELWVDLSMEQIFSHNRPKTHIAAVLELLVDNLQLGFFLSDRTLWTHAEAGISTEPDALFVSVATLESGQIRLVPGAKEGYVEVEGTPDMVLEVISPSSERKDTEVLRALYHRAGVREYWLVNARQTPPQFHILQHQSEGYAAAEEKDSWLNSPVFQHWFQFRAEPGLLGHPRYKLNFRPADSPSGSP